MTEGVLLQGDLATGVAGEIGQSVIEMVGITGGIADVCRSWRSASPPRCFGR